MLKIQQFILLLDLGDTQEESLYSEKILLNFNNVKWFCFYLEYVTKINDIKFILIVQVISSFYKTIAY